MTLRLYLLAGEPSGDKLGAAMMAGLKTLCPDVEFRGMLISQDLAASPASTLADFFGLDLGFFDHRGIWA